MKNLSLLLTVLSMFLVSACNDQAKRGNTAVKNQGFVDNMTETTRNDADDNQPPRLDMQVLKGGQELASFENNVFSREETVGLLVGDVINFNMSQTADDKDLPSSLQYDVTITHPSGVIEKRTSGFFNIAMQAAGRLEVLVKVSDSNSKVTSKNFVFYVSCSDAQKYSLIGDESFGQSIINHGSQIIPDSIFNFFNFNVTGLAIDSPSLASGGYSYIFDFNGDGMFDTNWITVPGNIIKEYVVYRGLQDVSIKIKDKACQIEKRVVIKNVDFGQTNCQPNNIPWEDGIINVPAPAASNCGTNLIGSYLFIQGEIEDAALVEPTKQVMVSQQVAPTPGSPQYMTCTMHFSNPTAGLNSTQKATLSVKGVNKYNHGIAGKKAHGLEVRFSNIDANVLADNIGMVVAFNSATAQNAVFEKVQYFTDEEPDAVGKKQRIYSMYDSNGNGQIVDDECQYQLAFQPMNGFGVCGVAGGSWGVVVYGSYSCNALKTSDAKYFAKLKKGEFHCLINSVPPCPVGGGGGGGLPPQLE